MHEGLADPGGVFVAGAAPTDADGDVWKAGQRADDEVVVGHEIVETLIDIGYIDVWGVSQGGHTLFHKGGDVIDVAMSKRGVGRVVEADFHAGRLAVEDGVSVDADIKIGKDGESVRRKHGQLFRWGHVVFALAGPVWLQRVLSVAASDTRKYIVGAQSGGDNQFAREKLSGAGGYAYAVGLLLDGGDLGLFQDVDVARLQCA